MTANIFVLNQVQETQCLHRKIGPSLVKEQTPISNHIHLKETEARNDCAGEAQQQRPTNRKNARPTLTKIWSWAPERARPTERRSSCDFDLLNGAVLSRRLRSEVLKP